MTLILKVKCNMYRIYESKLWHIMLTVTTGAPLTMIASANLTWEGQCFNLAFLAAVNKADFLSLCHHENKHRYLHKYKLTISINMYIKIQEKQSFPTKTPQFK